MRFLAIVSIVSVLAVTTSAQAPGAKPKPAPPPAPTQTAKPAAAPAGRPIGMPDHVLSTEATRSRRWRTRISCSMPQR